LKQADKKNSTAGKRSIAHHVWNRPNWGVSFWKENEERTYPPNELKIWFQKKEVIAVNGRESMPAYKKRNTCLFRETDSTLRKCIKGGAVIRAALRGEGAL